MDESLVFVPGCLKLLYASLNDVPKLNKSGVTCFTFGYKREGNSQRINSMHRIVVGLFDKWMYCKSRTCIRLFTD